MMFIAALVWLAQFADLAFWVFIVAVVILAGFIMFGRKGPK
jgi:hypothetical protein